MYVTALVNLKMTLLDDWLQVKMGNSLIKIIISESAINLNASTRFWQQQNIYVLCRIILIGNVVEC